MAADWALVATAFVWGVSFSVVKDTLGSVPPYWLLSLRFALALLALAAIGPARLCRGAVAAWRAVLVVGVLLQLGFALQTLGLQYTTPARSAFLTGCSVLLVPLLERLLLGVRLGARALLGVGLAVLGLTLLLRPGVAARVGAGELLTAGCALAFAGQIVAVGVYARRVPTRDLTAGPLAVVALLSAPLALATETATFAYPLRAWASLIFLGLFCSALAFGIQAWAQRRTSPTRTALIFALEPVFAAGVSVAVGLEALAASQWLGGLLVVAGVMLSSTRPRGGSGSWDGLPRGGKE